MRGLLKRISRPRILELAGVAFLIAWYAFFLLHPIDLVRGDIGRHMKNGELILSSLPDWDTVEDILRTNFYSSFHKEFPFINHHWASGIILYGVFSAGGFAGLQLFFAAVSALTLWLFLRISWRFAPFSTIFPVAFFLIPLIAERTEVRPEAFSALFAAIYLSLFFSYRASRLSFRTLWLAIIPLQILWVNLHIYFFLGPLLCALFFLCSDRLERKTYLSLFFSTIIASCLNPSFLAGVLYPARIFQNYGIVVNENVSVPAILKNNPDFANGLIFYVALLGVLASSVSFFAKKNRDMFILLILAFLFGFLAFRAARNLALFALFALPVLSIGASFALSRANAHWTYAVALAMMALTIFLNRGELPRAYHAFGFGVLAGTEKAGEFLQREGIQGPVFNDFDIGSYLIYYGFPSIRPFVDNRAEAYSASFFRNEYIPMQVDETIWKAKEGEYQFHAIVYSFEDKAPWALPFILHRLDDPSWAPVFANNYAIIFLKRTEENQRTIQIFEIPKSKFSLE